MLVAAIIMRARLQRKRLIRRRVWRQAAATRVIHRYRRARAILCHLSLLTPRRSVGRQALDTPARSFSALKAVRSAPGAEATVEAAGGHGRRRNDWADHGSDMLRAI